MKTVTIALTITISFLALCGVDLLIVHLRRKRKRDHARAIVRAFIADAVKGDPIAIKQVEAASRRLRSMGL